MIADPEKTSEALTVAVTDAIAGTKENFLVAEASYGLLCSADGERCTGIKFLRARGPAHSRE